MKVKRKNANLLKLISAFVVLAFNTNTLCGQNAVNDLTAINNAYYGTKVISMKMTFSIFENGIYDKAIESETGSFIKNGNYTYSSYGKLESVINNDYYLVIDNQEKEILISKIFRGRKTDQNDPSLLHEELAKIIKECRKVSFSALGENFGKYDFEINDPRYSRLVLEFSKSTFFLSKIILYYREKVNLLPEDQESRKILPVLEILYSDIRVSPPISATQFTYDKYLTLSKHGFLKKAAYKNYQLTDLYHSAN